MKNQYTATHKYEVNFSYYSSLFVTSMQGPEVVLKMFQHYVAPALVLVLVLVLVLNSSASAEI